MGTQKVKVWQQDLALGMYLVIYVVLAPCPQVFCWNFCMFMCPHKKSMFVLVCKNRVGVSGFGFWAVGALIYCLTKPFRRRVAFKIRILHPTM